MSLLLIGILGIVALLILFAINTPISLAMIITGYFGYGIVTNFTAANRVIASDIFTTFTSFSFSVIPMFTLMGFIAFHAGIGNKLYSLAYMIIGKLPGGLAMATQVACAIFGAVCGSSTATTATIAAIAIPEMRKYKYADKLSTAAVAAGGSLGIMIPPSIVLVLYGIATQQSISRLFLAGVLPGILLMILYMLAIYFSTWRDPSLAPAAEDSGQGITDIIQVLKESGLIEIIIVFGISLGGLFAGKFTATEAGGVGAAGILAVTLIRGSLKGKQLMNALADTTKSSAMIILLVAGATIFGRFMAISNIPFKLASWAGALPLPSFMIVAVILFIYLILGMFIDSLPLMLLTVPIFYPVVVESLGYDPIWFGVMMVLIVTMGCITPPVGINVYVVKGVTKDVPLQVVFQGIWPFLGAVIICSALLTAFPQIALFLPKYFIK